MTTPASLLGPDGPLKDLLPGFSPRPAQQDLAQRIADNLEHHGILIAESGTGTGKTLAYLVPALLSGKKVLISTGTKNLQDQLYHRDLPLVRQMMNHPVSHALLKGRANYLCLHQLENLQLQARFEDDKKGRKKSRGYAVGDLIKVRDWAQITRTGDISEIEGIPEDARIWPEVTSTADNCLGSKCDHYKKCHVNVARKKAMESEVVVVNHHLFFADMALKEEGFGQLLPGVDAIIFDEAHQIPEIASVFFGTNISGYQLLSLCRDTAKENVKEKSGIKELGIAIHDVEKATADFRLTLGREGRREDWQKLSGDRKCQKALQHLIGKLQSMTNILELASAKGQGLATCFRRASEVLDRLMMIAEHTPSDYVAWFVTTKRSFSLHTTPLDVSLPFRQHMNTDNKSWIFTSATLSISNQFDFYQEQLGLQDADTGIWDSPFDYQQQSLLYIPPDMPLPSDRHYTASVIETAIPILKASQGRAFILFTSHRALKLAAGLLADRLDYPVLMQGEMPRTELLDRFRDMGNAVLLGTSSFWEGVDVRGEALSCVIIDKLPFAAPDDPVLRARGVAMEAEGRSVFMEYQLPNAVITLKQGVGRLIRDVDDRGVLVLCDPRLLSKGYGKTFLRSIPAMPLTRELADVESFYAECVA